MAHDVFISYADKDKAVADAVCAVLERRRIRCFITPRDVIPGVPYAEALIEGIDGSRVLVLVFSGHANTSSQVARAVERACGKGLIIVPFRIEDVPMSKEMEYYLSSLHWLDALTPPLERHTEQLGETVALLLARQDRHLWYSMPSRTESAELGSRSLDAFCTEPGAAAAPVPAADDSDDWLSLILEESERTVQCGMVSVPDGDTDLTSDVQFTASWPATVIPGTSFVLDVWAHLPEERADVLARIKEEYAGLDTASKTKDGARLARGSALSVRLEIEGLLIDEPDALLPWEGHMTSADFVVTVPQALRPGPRAGTVTLSVGGLRVSRIAFQLLVVGDLQRPAPRGRVTSARHEKAFASYASEDRDRVLARVQGMETVMPMQVFVDVDTLRSSGGGWEEQLRARIDDAGVMYLFWSKAAQTSRWVDWEWRYALDRHGMEFIDPVPLEPPTLAPPPPELQKLHFDSKWLAFMRDPALS